MQPISIQTSLAGRSKHTTCLSAHPHTQQQAMSLDFCISLWPPPQPGSPSAGPPLANWGPYPPVAHPQHQFCSTSDEPHGQSWYAAYYILNSQREAKAKTWRYGDKRREDRGGWKQGHWLRGQSTGLHVKGDPDDSLGKALMCSLPFINKYTHEF